MLKKFIGAAALACSIGVMAAPANAAFTLENISLDFNGIDGLDDSGVPGVYTYSEVDALSFLATVQAVIDDNGNGVPNTGETGEVNGFGIITGIANDGGAINSDSGFNQLNSGAALPFVPPADGFEFSFEFEEVPITFVNEVGQFVHTGPDADSVGILRMYIDNLTDGDATSSACATETATAAADCTDGVQIAEWVILPGDGGALNLATFNGSDDATFMSVFLLAGVFFDENGNDLGCDSTNGPVADDCTQTLGIADSNFDADPDNNGAFGTFQPDSFACGTSAVDFCASEDGSFVLARIPEPTTLGLFGIGLMGLGLAARRRRK